MITVVYINVVLRPNDIAEGLDINETDNSYEHKIFHYNFGFHINFSFQPFVCEGFHDLLQKSMSFNKIAVLFVNRNSYRIHFSAVGKDTTASLVEKYDLMSKVNI